jgi:predicted ATPase
MRGVQIWRSGGVRSPVEEIVPSSVACLCHQALSEWHSNEVASSHATMAEAISLAKKLNDMQALVLALNYAWFLAQVDGNLGEVERCTSDVIELSTRHNIASWLAAAAILRGWARTVSGHTAEGIAWVEDGIRDHRKIGAMARRGPARCLAGSRATGPNPG